VSWAFQCSAPPCGGTEWLKPEARRPEKGPAGESRREGHMPSSKGLRATSGRALADAIRGRTPRSRIGMRACAEKSPQQLPGRAEAKSGHYGRRLLAEADSVTAGLAFQRGAYDAKARDRSLWDSSSKRPSRSPRQRSQIARSLIYATSTTCRQRHLQSSIRTSSGRDKFQNSGRLGQLRPCKWSGEAKDSRSRRPRKHRLFFERRDSNGSVPWPLDDPGYHGEN